MSGKRGRGEGYVKRLPSGSWRCQLMDGYTANGKRKIVNFTAPTRAEALDKLHEYQQNAEQRAALAKQGITFAEFADQWYEDYRTQVERSTYSNYRYTLALLKKQFGEKPLIAIKTSDVNRFINRLESEGYSASQISKCRSMLIQIFDSGEADDLIPKNYARHAFRSTKRAVKSERSHEKDAFTVEETETLLRDLPDDMMGNTIRLMLVTGLRLQEMIALTPRDIAEDGSWVRVEKAVKMVDGVPELGVPKSAKSRRVVPIAPKYRPIAVWLRTNGGQAFLWCAPHRESLLYATDNIRRRYYHTLEQVPQVRRLSPHCCRHTFVTMLQRQGVPLETIARLTGHTDIKTTDEYLHISGDTLAEAVTALESLK